MTVKSELENLLIRMEKAKEITEWALENCDEDEKQNIIWMDCRIEFWITSLHTMMRLNQEVIDVAFDELYPDTSGLIV